MTTLSIVGCGRLGKTLGLLFKALPGFALEQILNRSFASARAAAEFIGAGAPALDWAALRPADYIVVTAPDGAIADCAASLAGSHAVRPGTVVFHCSGSQPAAILGDVKRCGASIASVHPIKSFADPSLAASTFPGTYCALEGESAACEKLGWLFATLGARLLFVDAQSKLEYHAGSVFASNYLTVLIETGLRCFAKAGIPRSQALECLLPMLEGTLLNNRALGPARALTGPIARGEAKLVAAQLAALRAWDPRIAEAYRALGSIALELSAEQGAAPPEALQEIKRNFEAPNPKS